jgi:hypothetical protein
MTHRQTRLFGALLALTIAAVPSGAFAQAAPSDAPSYVDSAAARDQETIHGRVASFDGVDNLQVDDDRGFVDTVHLQPDTIVNGGTELRPGVTVTIVGVAQGSVFAANRIDVGDGPPSDQPPAVPAAAGTVVTGVIAIVLDSKDAYVGEAVALNNVSSSDGSIAGATLLGTVTQVTPPGQGRNAQLRMHFDSLQRADRTTEPIDGVVLSVDVQTKSNAAKEIGGAVVGMLAGNALAKTLLGASGGGLIGAVGGYLIAKDNRADVVIPANSAVTVQVVRLRRRQAN